MPKARHRRAVGGFVGPVSTGLLKAGTQSTADGRHRRQAAEGSAAAVAAVRSDSDRDSPEPRHRGTSPGLVGPAVAAIANLAPRDRGVPVLLALSSAATLGAATIPTAGTASTVAAQVAAPFDHARAASPLARAAWLTNSDLAAQGGPAATLEARRAVPQPSRDDERQGANASAPERAQKRTVPAHTDRDRRSARRDVAPSRGQGRSAHMSPEAVLHSSGPWLPPEVIAKAVGAPASAVSANWPPIERALREQGMTDVASRIAAAATVVAEVGTRFRPINEYGGPAYFTRMYEGRSDLGNTQTGDGARFHGRGYIQLTGRANYRTYGEHLDVPLEEHPELALHADVAARVLADYFKQRQIDESARRGAWRLVRLKVNGGYNGLATYERAVSSLLHATLH